MSTPASVWRGIRATPADVETTPEIARALARQGLVVKAATVVGRQIIDPIATKIVTFSKGIRRQYVSTESCLQTKG